MLCLDSIYTEGLLFYLLIFRFAYYVDCTQPSVRFYKLNIQMKFLSTAEVYRTFQFFVA
ncbi:hypothetical protein D3C85_1888350 [compost metagenome]